MRLSLLRITGFRGAKGTVELVLPAGFAVICGRNGSGKSTLCDAVEFALTGQLERYLYETDKGDKVTEKGESILDYVWWRGPGLVVGEPEVTLGIMDDDGKEHLFTRGRSGLTRGSEEHLRELVCVATRATPKDLSDVSRTTLFRDEEITRLSVDLPEANRFSFVRSAVGFGGFSPVESTAQEAVALLRNRANRIQGEYEAVRKEVGALTARLSELRSRTSQAGDTSSAELLVKQTLSVTEPPPDDGSLLVRGRQGVAVLRTQTDALVRGIRALEEVERRMAEVRTDTFRQELSKLESSATALAEQLETLSSQGEQLSATLSNYQRTEPLEASRAQLVEHGVRLGLVDGTCPLCGSKVSGESFDSHVEELKRHVQSTSATLSAVTRQYTETLENERRVRRDLEAIQQRIAASSGALDLLAQQRAQVIVEVNQAIGSPQDISVEGLKVTLEQKRLALTTLERAVNMLEASQSYQEITDVERELEAVRQRSDALSKELSRAQAARARAQSTADTIHRLSGELMDEQVAALSPLLTELYLRLRPHVDWQEIRYRMRGDVRRFLSLEVGDGLNPRFLFSSGQRRAMGIAFLLAVHLSRSWCRLKTLVLDDPVQHVDDFRALHLAEVLSAMRRKGEQVICTVEDPALADLLCRRLRSTDSEDGSLVSMNYEPGQGVHVESVRAVPQLPRAVLKLA